VDHHDVKGWQLTAEPWHCQYWIMSDSDPFSKVLSELESIHFLPKVPMQDMWIACAHIYQMAKCCLVPNFCSLPF
jgi:hypothetical protein